MVMMLAAWLESFYSLIPTQSNYLGFNMRRPRTDQGQAHYSCFYYDRHIFILLTFSGKEASFIELA